MKTRKPRTTGRSLNIEGTTHYIDGAPYYMATPAERKIYSRMKNGLCPGCGQLTCRCKSKKKR